MPTVYHARPPKDKRLSDLLARALDPAAPSPEAESSAVMAIRHARRESMTIDLFIGAIDPGRRLSPPPSPRQPQRPAACDVRMRRGKYASHTLADIAEQDLGYLRWVANEFSDYDLREAAGVVLKFVTTGRAA